MNIVEYINVLRSGGLREGNQPEAPNLEATLRRRNFFFFEKINSITKFNVQINFIFLKSLKSINFSSFHLIKSVPNFQAGFTLRKSDISFIAQQIRL